MTLLCTGSGSKVSRCVLSPAVSVRRHGQLRKSTYTASAASQIQCLVQSQKRVWKEPYKCSVTPFFKTVCVKSRNTVGGCKKVGSLSEAREVL